MGGMMDGSGMGNSFFGGFFGFGLIILILIIIIFFIVRWMMKPHAEEQNSSNRVRGEAGSKEVLKKRLASGEITEEEYDRLKKKLDD
ncbi:SHOCT domain-containing protein [Halobacillus sp. Nhm2S1]|uniref:SHOCT domain-containing protein n=1 Tax=Halobacillus sp. Nhm2S1 TaxID=2866716 RepID=UPI001C72F549|nr:SHOCT domain-containing protein [Halobacillus sp. Nhm2S1]MBX0359398.1 SHOCT domain-containing protein [Halobacillus sp. Nhm2S1]